MIRAKRKPRYLDCFLCGTRCNGKAAFARHLTTHHLSDAYAATIAAQQAEGVEAGIRLESAILAAPLAKPSPSALFTSGYQVDRPYTFGEGGSYAI